MRECQIAGCARRVKARGFCDTHYHQDRRARGYKKPKRKISDPGVLDDFNAKILVRGDDECWPWEGGFNSKNYGVFSLEGVAKLAHRVAWEQANGPIPADMTVDHLCQNKKCMNTAHMEIVSRAENSRRAGRPLECRHGAPIIYKRDGVTVQDCQQCADDEAKAKRRQQERRDELAAENARRKAEVESWKSMSVEEWITETFRDPVDVVLEQVALPLWWSRLLAGWGVSDKTPLHAAAQLSGRIDLGVLVSICDAADYFRDELKIPELQKPTK
ncbi:HNH endonuclease signature motif containing protein [Actinomycetaceae bacterium MB13-C1-2]|nr:HNH endonuclease signature motif containing protein [Actinomycetaceae bacterium MB13-C1-2]